jgi:5-deoxy-glucuronate isomerase
VLTTLAVRGRDTQLIGLRLLELGPGERTSLTDDGEVCAVVLGGRVEVAVAGVELGTACRRSGVFDGPGDAVYVPPAAPLAVESPAGAMIAVASAPAGLGGTAEARLLPAASQPVREAGRSNWSRSIRTILGPDEPAARLIVGETINPSGNWSSYPPHKHDRQDPPEEVALEEIYFYRLNPQGGFAVQLVYDDEREQARVVRDGDVVAIPSGYHPVVAAPGYELYYLWVMAGEGRQLAPFLDPRHAWVEERRPAASSMVG